MGWHGTAWVVLHAREASRVWIHSDILSRGVPRLFTFPLLLRWSRQSSEPLTTAEFDLPDETKDGLLETGLLTWYSGTKPSVSRQSRVESNAVIGREARLVAEADRLSLNVFCGSWNLATVVGSRTITLWAGRANAGLSWWAAVGVKWSRQ